MCSTEPSPYCARARCSSSCRNGGCPQCAGDSSSEMGYGTAWASCANTLSWNAANGCAPVDSACRGNSGANPAAHVDRQEIGEGIGGHGRCGGGKDGHAGTKRDPCCK